MLEMNLLNAKKKIGGVGYLIEGLSNEEFASYEEVSNLAGVTQGTLHNEGAGWLRFDYEGTELTVSKKTIRHSISWDHLNSVGCVFGGKMITILGRQYKVRLVRGADHNPTQLPTNVGHFLEGTHNSEWSRLFYPLVKDDSFIPPEIRNPNAPYTRLDLGTINEDGRFSWCQETHQISTSSRVRRGFSGVTYLSYANSSSMDSSFGWRPVLERVL